MKELNAQEVYEKLGAPFLEDEIEWRAQQVIEGKNNKPPSALVVPYIQSRAIMNRLDEVVGWQNWENIVQELPGGGILQGIRLQLSETRSITKWDGADRTQIESTKGGISSAFKRAAVLFNIGRYLYSETPRWEEIKPNKDSQKDEYVQDKKKNIYGYFTPPSLSNNSRTTNNNNNQNKNQTNKNNHQSMEQTSKVPSGMIECKFKGLLDKPSNSGPYLEVWLESYGELACLYAIGEMRTELLALDLQEGCQVAITSSPDESGNFIIQNLLKVA